MSKPATKYTDQLALLKTRGLSVQDEAFALHMLEHHSYYRLSGYRFPFVAPGHPDQFLPGSTFTQLWELYHFDRSLRQLVLEACKRIEISVRSRWAYELSHRLGPLAYLENSHFSDPLAHAKTLTKLDAELKRSKEDFIRHHVQSLKMPWPPAWVMAEIISFGNVSSLIGQLRDPAIRQAIATSYGLDESTFCPMLHHLCVMRNTAAHHGRLWNRKFNITFQLPRKKPAHLRPNFFVPPGSQNSHQIYNSLILLVHFCRCIEPASHWPQRLIHCLIAVDPARLPDMGFPTHWQSLPIWHQMLAPPSNSSNP